MAVQQHVEQNHLRRPRQGNDVRPESSDPGNAELRRGDAFLLSDSLDPFDDRYVVLEVLVNCCQGCTRF